MRMNNKMVTACSTLLLALLSACSDDKPTATEATPEPAPTEAVELNADVSIAESHTPGVPGGVASAVKEWNATVMSVDTESRQFVVQDDAGNQKTLTAPAEMVNFSQLRVGDKVHALLTLETAVFMTDGTAEDSSMNIVVAPSVGEKPGLHAVDETETTAIVEALDIPNRLATLKFADGSTQVVVVRDDVQLSEAQIGAQLKIVMSTSLTIDVQSPVAR